MLNCRGFFALLLGKQLNILGNTVTAAGRFVFNLSVIDEHSQIRNRRILRVRDR